MRYARTAITIYVTQVDPYNDSTVRGGELLTQVQAILDETGADHVILIGHSQGALDVPLRRQQAGQEGRRRRARRRRQPRHAHRRHRDRRICRAGHRRARRRSCSSSATRCSIPTASPTPTPRLRSSSSSTAGAADFTAKYPDSPDVDYFSIAGRSNGHDRRPRLRRADRARHDRPVGHDRRRHAILLAATVAIINGSSPIAADQRRARSPSSSAKWGTFLGCVPADHMEEVCQLAGTPTPAASTASTSTARWSTGSSPAATDLHCFARPRSVVSSAHEGSRRCRFVGRVGLGLGAVALADRRRLPSLLPRPPALPRRCRFVASSRRPAGSTRRRAAIRRLYTIADDEPNSSRLPGQGPARRRSGDAGVPRQIRRRGAHVGDQAAARGHVQGAREGPGRDRRRDLGALRLRDGAAGRQPDASRSSSCSIYVPAGNQHAILTFTAPRKSYDQVRAAVRQDRARDHDHEVEISGRAGDEGAAPRRRARATPHLSPSTGMRSSWPWNRSAKRVPSSGKRTGMKP